MKPKLVVTFAIVLGIVAWGANPRRPSAAVKSRTFRFIYGFTVQPPPSGKLGIWFPAPVSDDNQDIKLFHITSPVLLQKNTDSTYGNTMFYQYRKFYLNQPEPREASTFLVTYQVTRREYSRGTLADLMQYNREPVAGPPNLARFLQPDALVPINDRFQKMAADITAGKTGVVDRAQAIYDYVFHNLRYDKTGEGWGHGDAMWACDSKHGNCTDFHSLFIALMRAEKIPARFEIGFPVPASKTQGEIPGYHCWAEFYVDGLGWVPVDISEAWKNPAKHDYFFGSVDADRVQFTIGRDLTLNPAQGGPPLNYFIYPYAEVNGQPWDKIETKFSFEDLPASGGQ